MTLRIYIPSLGRADRVARSPAPQFSWKADLWWVVSPEEAMRYLWELDAADIPGNILPCPLQGRPGVSLPDIRLWIAQHAQADGVEHHMQLDDDICFLVRKSEDDWRLRKAEPDDIDQMIEWVDRKLLDHEIVSISGREGNNREGAGDRDKLARLNTRTMRALAYRTREFLQLRHARMDDLEDFDLTLQTLRRGGSNIVSFWWAQGQRMTQEPGGCELYRTNESHDAACRELARLHYPHVSLVQKENKGGGEFGKRTEVRVSWKGAWLEGQSRARDAGEGDRGSRDRSVGADAQPALPGLGAPLLRDSQDVDVANVG